MPQFVLLEHTWDGTHWDLMLEAGQVLKTWALETAPRPGTTVRARQLPDHRRVYLDYEGPISGDRGAVRRVDRGDYQVVIWENTEVVVLFSGAQLNGPMRLWKDGSIEAGVCRETGEGWRALLGNRD